MYTCEDLGIEVYRGPTAMVILDSAPPTTLEKIPTFKDIMHRRMECIIHHENWKDKIHQVLDMITAPSEMISLPNFTPQNLRQWIERDGCSCGYVQTVNISMQDMIKDIEDLVTFYKNFFNKVSNTENLEYFMKPLMELADELLAMPDLQNYVFLRWIKNVLHLILIFGVWEIKADDENI